MSTQITSVKFGTTDITRVSLNDTWYYWPNHTTDIIHTGGFTVHGSKTGTLDLHCWYDSAFGEVSNISLTWYSHNMYNGNITSSGIATTNNYIYWAATFKVAGVLYADSGDWQVRDGTVNTPKSRNVYRDWLEILSTPIVNL